MTWKCIRWALLLGYLSAMAYFAFRPFRRVPGCRYPPARVERGDGGLRFFAGAALEDREGGSNLRKAFRNADCISVEVLLKAGSLEQGGPARIISYSRDTMSRNFMLGQEGNGLVFRLRTTRTDHNGMCPELLVPGVFSTNRFQHLVVVYDGASERLYVDGKLRPRHIALTGGFGEWGRNHRLVLGDEVPGGRVWNGTIRRFAIYDRALGADEIAALQGGTAVGGAVVERDFQGLESGELGGLEPLEYRNLFVSTDRAAYSLKDCLLNILGFVPLPFFVFPLFSPQVRRMRTWVAAVAIPLLLGGMISGFIEWVQRQLDGRVPCALDLAYNLLGTLTGCLLLWVVVSIRRRGTERRRTIA